MTTSIDQSADSSLGKRKAHGENVSSTAGKRKRSKQSKQNKKADNGYLDSYADVDEELNINRAIGRMDPTEITEYVEGIYSHPKFRGDKTEMEMRDLRLPVGAVRDMTSWTEPRKLDGMADFVKMVIGEVNEGGSAGGNKFGCPHTLVVTASAIRAADVVRYVGESISGSRLTFS
jgi:protein CMS1